MPPELRAAAIITVEEQLTGRYSEIRKAATDVSLAYSYKRLAETIEFYNKRPIFPCDEAAIAHYRELSAL